MQKTAKYTQSEDERSTKKKASKGYALWLKENGILSKDIYDSQIRDAEADYYKVKSGYGAQAEGLASYGLSASGYSDYISGKAYESLQKSRQSALREYSQNQRENAKNYTAYLASVEDAQSKLYSSVGDYIVNNSLTGYSDAYKYAINAGLDEERAKRVAESATKIAIYNVKKEISRLILNNKLSENEAKNYALFMGLSEKDAELIKDFAKKYNTISFESGSDYVDYIKEQTKGNTLR